MLNVIMTFRFDVTMIFNNNFMNRPIVEAQPLVCASLTFKKAFFRYPTSSTIAKQINRTKVKDKLQCCVALACYRRDLGG